MLYVTQMSLLAAAVLFAFIKGGGAERCVAVILAGIATTDFFYRAIFPEPIMLGDANLGHILIDLVAFLGILTVALRANRLWTLLAASTQLLSLMSHLVRLLSLEMWEWSYAIMAQAPSYLLIILLGIGTLSHARRAIRE